MISATTIDHQMPSTPHNRGSNKTATIWKTRVRRKEIIAEVKPSFNAVKNPEAKIANPIKRKEKEYTLNPLQVNSKSSVSYPTKNFESGNAKVSANRNIQTEKIAIMHVLLLRSPFSSP